MHVGRAGAEVGLVLDHGGLGFAVEGRVEGGEDLGVVVGVAVDGDGVVGGDGGVADLAGHGDEVLVAGLGVGEAGAGGELLAGHGVDLLVVGVVAAEVLGGVGGLLAGRAVDEADLPEAFFEGRQMGKVCGLSGGEGEDEGGGEDGLLHGKSPVMRWEDVRTEAVAWV